MLRSRTHSSARMVASFSPLKALSWMTQRVHFFRSPAACKTAYSGAVTLIQRFGSALNQKMQT